MKVVKQLFICLVCSVSLLTILHEQLYAVNAPRTRQPVTTSLQPSEKEEWKIQDKARQITVRVFSQNNTASGILIERQDYQQDGQKIYSYLVITNNHVVRDTRSEYRIETPDGRVYQAVLHPQSKTIFRDSIDLALLYFSSNFLYTKAELGDSSKINNEDRVFVAGFACEDSYCEKDTEFIFKPGTSLLLDKPLAQAYQLGFTSATKPGSSGGVVLNKKGELVAINGRGKYALKNGQYVYEDGNQPSKELQKFMRHFAWGIPINRYKEVALQKPFETIQLPKVNEGTLPNNVKNENYLNNSASINNDKTWNWPMFLLVLLTALLFIFSIVTAILWYYIKKPKQTQSKLDSKANHKNNWRKVNLISEINATISRNQKLIKKINNINVCNKDLVSEPNSHNEQSVIPSLYQRKSLLEEIMQLNNQQIRGSAEINDYIYYEQQQIDTILLDQNNNQNQPTNKAGEK